ncbi:uncharacterized protein LOC123879560 [Maniola jurtina]|uniref:uncharacterized protein LOC123879560 n=1 Tax=Maniola jurtina TaxID=191418 RepID=UPI001E68A868|nr:uncharacterized protein LOC123879560 [Maniola jurtina]
MFQYEYEKRPQSCDSRATGRDSRATGRDSRTTVHDWHSRPLPPRPEDRLPTKTSVPLKVWVIASASCFAVCGALVLATIVITRTAASDNYTSRGLYAEAREPVYPMGYPQPRLPTTTEGEPSTTQEDNDLNYPILEKLSIFKNIVGNRDRKKSEENLVSKPQIHPIHDIMHHPERKIEKKDQAILPDNLNDHIISKHDFIRPIYQGHGNPKVENHESSNEAKLFSNDLSGVPEFKPTLPDLFLRDNIKLSDGYIAGLKKVQDDNYEEYYDDNNLYDDYIQSNSMTSYLIEKVQELHDWIVTDPDFDAKAIEKRNSVNSTGNNEFGQLLKALNESLIEGNVTIVMSKLRELYFGENFTQANQSRKVILSNSTNLLSFGILTLDVMLLHNIQLMAWESQEAARNKMLKDPDVFAFNALFMEPSKVEAKRNEIYHQYDAFSKRQNLRQETEDSDFGKNLLENVLEIGMSTARAAIHLGRAFKNTKMVLTQISNRETLNANIQNQISRNIDANTHALNHLQTSFNKNDSSSANVANATSAFYTDLDCVWLLYCKNLVATAKLNAPYGTMARINGLALRMLTGEVPADRALDIMLYEVLTGWTDLKCTEMFPRCSKANPATVVLESILQPLRKSQSSSNRL